MMFEGFAGAGRRTIDSSAGSDSVPLAGKNADFRCPSYLSCLPQRRLFAERILLNSLSR
jgi:hypothetical protein